jgi:hypothetical protein
VSILHVHFLKLFVRKNNKRSFKVHKNISDKILLRCNGFTAWMLTVICKEMYCYTKCYTNYVIPAHVNNYVRKTNVKLSLQHSVEVHRVVICRGFNIFWTIGSWMAVRSALRAGRPLPPGRFLVLAESTPGPQCDWKN